MAESWLLVLLPGLWRLKVPLGTWLLGLVTALKCLGVFRPTVSGNEAYQSAVRARSWLDQFLLLLPAIAIVTFVSSQTGVNRHFRYVLPAFPFLFIWISNVANLIGVNRRLTVVICAALLWSVSSSLWIYPHSMSYFNEAAGGPIRGRWYLLDANLDWGQDLFYLTKWCEMHPEARPIHLVFQNSYSADLFNNSYTGVGTVKYHEDSNLVIEPGWYAVSVQRMHDTNDNYLYFRDLKPVARAGYSIYIYNIDCDNISNINLANSTMLPSPKREISVYNLLE